MYIIYQSGLLFIVSTAASPALNWLVLGGKFKKRSKLLCSSEL
jgi:hypothetical protein